MTIADVKATSSMIGCLVASVIGILATAVAVVAYTQGDVTRTLAGGILAATCMLAAVLSLE